MPSGSPLGAVALMDGWVLMTAVWSTCQSRSTARAALPHLTLTTTPCPTTHPLPPACLQEEMVEKSCEVLQCCIDPATSHPTVNPCTSP